MAVLTSVCTLVGIDHVVYALDASTQFLLLFCQVEEREEENTTTLGGGGGCFMAYCTRVDQITIYQSGHRLYLFHCTSSLAFIWEQQAVSW